jgi:hypothetical protein
MWGYIFIILYYGIFFIIDLARKGSMWSPKQVIIGQTVGDNI